MTVIAADSDEEAELLATSQQKSFIDGAFRRKRTLLQPPIDNIDDYWHPHEKAQLESMLSCSFIGSLETVQEQVTGFIAEHQPDELIVATQHLRPAGAAGLARASREPARMPPYALEPAASEHAEIRAALHELVGRFLADYERAAQRARADAHAGARARVRERASRSRSARSPPASAATRRTSACSSTGSSSASWSSAGRTRATGA